MAGSSLGEDRKPQMEIDVEDTTNIVPPLTQSLSLTCSLVPATSSDPNDKKADFVSITAVYITLKAPGKTDKDVAKVTSFKPDQPTLSDLLPRATILGFDLSDGFIKVGVAEPDSQHAGEYTCKVVGLNTAEDTVTLTHKATVQYTAPDVGDLADYIHTLELQLEEKDASQDTEMKRKNQKQDTEINKRVSKADIQQGYGFCYPGTGERDNYVQINFPHRYSKVPNVFLSTRHIFGNAAYNPDGGRTDDDTGSEYYINADQVTQTGFRLRCRVYKYSYINEMSVYWIAFPSP